MRAAECVIRFLLGAMLSGAEIFGGYAPFGLGLVAASGSGLDGFCALLGACFGYLSFQGFAEGLRYVAGCILAFSLAFAFFDVKAYRKSWFMPLAAAGMDGITGFVYLSDRGWSPEGLIFFGTELLLCGASAYFYRIAFTPWTEKREEEGLTPRADGEPAHSGGTLLLTLSKITLLGDLSVGRCAAAAAVMATAYKGGIGVGATVGVACGLGMDLAAGGMPFYSMAFALSGVMCGCSTGRGGWPPPWPMCSPMPWRCCGPGRRAFTSPCSTRSLLPRWSFWSSPSAPCARWGRWWPGSPGTTPRSGPRLCPRPDGGHGSRLQEPVRVHAVGLPPRRTQ